MDMLTRSHELITQLRNHDLGDGNIGIIVRQALDEDPDVDYEDVLAIVTAAEEDAEAER